MIFEKSMILANVVRINSTVVKLPTMIRNTCTVGHYTRFGYAAKKGSTLWLVFPELQECKDRFSNKHLALISLLV